MPRHKLSDKERGHRPRLSDDEPVIRYTIRMPESLKLWLDRLGPDRVRAVLGYLRTHNATLTRLLEVLRLPL